MTPTRNTHQKGISESLAGRIGLMSLLPFETEEIPPALRAGQLLHGSYPALVIDEYEGSREWYASYFGTYIEKDVRLVFDIGKLSDFQRLVRLLAARVAQEQNSASLSRELGINAKTIESWISVLEAGYLIFRLEPFHGNIGKRLIKRPKLFFWDTGLVCHLTGQRTEEALEGGPLAGPVFETLIVSELLKKNLHQGADRAFSFYRDNAGNEVDLIIHDRDENVVSFLEIKSSQTAKAEWAYRLEKTTQGIAEALAGPSAGSRHIIA
jgi:predicted AAA+ superfamily ATPase